MKREFVETVMAPDATVEWNARGRARAAMASGLGGVRLRRESIQVGNLLVLVFIYVFFSLSVTLD